MSNDEQTAITAALRLENARRRKAAIEINRESEAETLKMVADHGKRGILQSGYTGRRIVEIHQDRGKKMVDAAINARQYSLARVSDLATDYYFQQLTKELEGTAETIRSSLPHHMGKYLPNGGGAEVASGGEPPFSDVARELRAYARDQVEIMRGEYELSNAHVTHSSVTAREESRNPGAAVDPRRVWVVHGRNTRARDAMFTFLRSINLDPIEWDEAVSFTGTGTPFIGEVLDKAFEQAQAVVVLLTGDDVARLGTVYHVPNEPPHERELTPQPRPNVLFEAGMAFGRHPERTILVSLGQIRPFSDVAGRNEVRITNGPKDRTALATRLRNAGCDVKTEGKSDWFHAGDFDGAVQEPDNEAIIDAKSEEIKDLKAQVIRLQTPAYDDALAEDAKATIASLHPVGQELLRFVLKYGPVRPAAWGQFWASKPEYEKDLYSASVILEKQGVLLRLETRHPGGIETHWDVAPAFKPVLKALLFSHQ